MAASTSANCEPEEERLLTWSAQSTKLLISQRREKNDLFVKGKVRKNVAWQRVAETFNSISSVKVTGEQCANKWKKLEEKYKKVKEHNDKTGNDRKVCEFQAELEEFYGNDPKIVPASTVSSLSAADPATDSCTTDEEEQLPLASARKEPKKKKKRRSKSSASEMITFLTEYKEEKRKEDQAKIALAQKMHGEKMGVMERFLDILSKKEH